MFFTIVFFGCFHFSPLFFKYFLCWLHFFLYHHYSLPWLLFCCFFVRYFLFVLLYCESYAFQRAFSAQAFFTLHSFPTFATVLQVLQIRERLFYSQVFFTLHSFPTFDIIGCFTNLLSRVHWELTVFPWCFSASQLGFKIQTWFTKCFESPSVQQKVLLGRFYLWVKTLRMIILTSSGFWIHSLTAAYNVRCMSCPPGHRNSYFNYELWYITIFSCCLLMHKSESNHLVQNLL